MAFGGESYFDPQFTMLSAVLVAFFAMCGRRLRKILESILARLFTTYFASGSKKAKIALSRAVAVAAAQFPAGAKKAVEQLGGNGNFPGMPTVPDLNHLSEALKNQEKASGTGGGAVGTEVELVPAGASPSKAAGDLEEGGSATAPAATISKAEATDKTEAKAFVGWLDGVSDEKVALIGEALLAAVHEDGARVERSTKEVFFVLQVSETFNGIHSGPLRAIALKAAVFGVPAAFLSLPLYFFRCVCPRVCAPVVFHLRSNLKLLKSGLFHCFRSCWGCSPS
jgi:hypothetical protein